MSYSESDCAKFYKALYISNISFNKENSILCIVFKINNSYKHVLIKIDSVQNDRIERIINNYTLMFVYTLL